MIRKIAKRYCSLYIKYGMNDFTPTSECSISYQRNYFVMFFARWLSLGPCVVINPRPLAYLCSMRNATRKKNNIPHIKAAKMLSELSKILNHEQGRWYFAHFQTPMRPVKITRCTNYEIYVNGINSLQFKWLMQDWCNEIVAKCERVRVK